MKPNESKLVSGTGPGGIQDDGVTPRDDGTVKRLPRFTVTWEPQGSLLGRVIVNSGGHQYKAPIWRQRDGGINVGEAEQFRTMSNGKTLRVVGHVVGLSELVSPAELGLIQDRIIAFGETGEL